MISSWTRLSNNGSSPVGRVSWESLTGALEEGPSVWLTHMAGKLVLAVGWVCPGLWAGPLLFSVWAIPQLSQGRVAGSKSERLKSLGSHMTPLCLMLLVKVQVQGGRIHRFGFFMGECQGYRRTDGARDVTVVFFRNMVSIKQIERKEQGEWPLGTMSTQAPCPETYLCLLDLSEPKEYRIPKNSKEDKKTFLSEG